MQRKGNILDVGLVMVILFVVSIIFLLSTHVFGEFSGKWTNNTIVNSSQASIDAVEDVENLLNTRFDWVGFTLLIGLTLSIIITGWLVSGNPIFTFIYFIIIVILVATSAIFSFTWEKVTDQAIFATTLNNYPILDLILTNFPIYITIVGFVGMIVTFAKPR